WLSGAVPGHNPKEAQLLLGPSIDSRPISVGSSLVMEPLKAQQTTGLPGTVGVGVGVGVPVAVRVGVPVGVPAGGVPVRVAVVLAGFVALGVPVGLGLEHPLIARSPRLDPCWTSQHSPTIHTSFGDVRGPLWGAA